MCQSFTIIYSHHASFTIDLLMLFGYNKYVRIISKRVGRIIRIQGFKDSRIQVKDSRGQGVEESRGMLKNYKELKVWQKSKPRTLCIN